MQTLTEVLQQIQAGLRTQTAQMLQDTGDEFKSKADSAVADWSKKPEFTSTLTIDDPDHYDVLIVPSGGAKDIWKWVDLGTGKWGPKHAPYLILPKTAGGMLKFRGGYSARTAPVARAQVGTGQANGAWVQSKGVIYPGIESRKFFETWMNELSPSLDVRELQYIAEIF